MENEEMVEVEVQDFDGKEYLLFKTVEYENELYDIFSNLEDPKDIKVFKQQQSDTGTMYIEPTDLEYLNALAALNM